MVTEDGPTDEQCCFRTTIVESRIAHHAYDSGPTLLVPKSLACLTKMVIIKRYRYAPT